MIRGTQQTSAIGYGAHFPIQEQPLWNSAVPRSPQDLGASRQASNFRHPTSTIPASSRLLNPTFRAPSISPAPAQCAYPVVQVPRASPIFFYECGLSVRSGVSLYIIVAVRARCEHMCARCVHDGNQLHRARAAARSNLATRGFQMRRPFLFRRRCIRKSGAPCAPRRISPHQRTRCMHWVPAGRRCPLLRCRLHPRSCVRRLPSRGLPQHRKLHGWPPLPGSPSAQRRGRLC